MGSCDGKALDMSGLTQYNEKYGQVRKGEAVCSENQSS